MTRTQGVIVESVAVNDNETVRLITYDYSAQGVRRRGTCFLESAAAHRRMFQVGELLPVYFVIDKPDVSYAPIPPRVTVIAVSGTVFVALGIVIILFGLKGLRPMSRLRA
jgi:hypothetical protein